MNHPQQSDTGPVPPQPYVMYVLALFLLANVFNYMDRMLLAVLLEPIKHDLGLSDTQMGLLGGLAFAVTYATVGIPIARWADRGTRRSIVALALAVWSGMTAACGLAQNYLQLFLARVGVGVGEAGGTPPIHSMITDLVPAHWRSTAMAVFTMGAAIGATIGLAAGGWLADAYSWRWAFVVLGLPGVVLALVIRLTVREPSRAPAAPVLSTQSVALTVDRPFRLLWSIVPLRYVMLGGAALAFVSYGVNQWAPSYFIRQFGLTAAEVGAGVGLAYGLGAAVGLLIGGLAADRLTRHDPAGPVRVLVTASLLGAPLYFLTFAVDHVALAMGLLFVASAVAAGATAPLMAVAQHLSPPQIRATTSAVLMFFISVVGLGGASWFIGALSDALEPRVGIVALRYSLEVAVAALLVAALLFMQCLRRLVPTAAAVGTG